MARKRDRRLSSAYVSERRRALKRIAVQRAGGACQLCGYDKCLRALSFHHQNAEQKLFGVGQGTTYSLGRILAESAKCVLLCANCHAETHAIDDALAQEADRAYIASYRAGVAQAEEQGSCKPQVGSSTLPSGSEAETGVRGQGNLSASKTERLDSISGEPAKRETRPWRKGRGR